MSIKNDNNKIPKVVVSPSNVRVEYVKDKNTVFNGTLNESTLILDGETGNRYSLDAEADFNGSPATLDYLTQSKLQKMKEQPKKKSKSATKPKTKPASKNAEIKKS